MTQPTAQLTKWRFVLRYLAVMAAGNLAWEVGHVRLYTIWLDGTAGQIAFAVLHCTLGDVLIAAVTLGLALALLGRGWRAGNASAVAALTVFLALVYTVFSEWLNISVRGTWAYRDIMPTLPPFETGLTPVLQWIVLPPVALHLARRT